VGASVIAQYGLRSKIQSLNLNHSQFASVATLLMNDLDIGSRAGES
jgi:hypothetical protein